MTHYKFPSIEQFRHVKRNVEHAAQYKGTDEKGDPVYDRTAKLPTLSFKGTVKVHGTNAAIVCTEEGIYYQSRERIITPESDNCGFAQWATQLPKSVFKECNNHIIYGEWAGQGIQKGVAVSEVPKFFVIFGIKNISTGEWTDKYLSFHEYRIFNIRDFPYKIVQIDFEQPAEAINTINELTLRVEKECPVGKQFGVSGIGEGYVWTCIEEKYRNSNFWFKTKGDKHSQSHVTKLANVNVDEMKSVEEFVAKTVHNGRLEQGWHYLKEMNLPQTEKSTGDFIRWIFNDILKEEKDVIVASGLNEKKLGGPISVAAKRWFFGKLKQ